MNYRPENGKRLSRKFIELAEERIEYANIACEKEDVRNTVSNSYYAVLHAGTAMLITKDLVPKSHQGALRLLGYHFIKPGIIEEVWSGVLRRIEKYRHDADYSADLVFTLEEAREVYNQTVKFLTIAKQIVKQKKWE